MKNLAIISALLAMSENMPYMGIDEPVPCEPSPPKEIKPKGKLFIIEGIEIYALNEKNAKRKFNKLVNNKQ